MDAANDICRKIHSDLKVKRSEKASVVITGTVRQRHNSITKAAGLLLDSACKCVKSTTLMTLQPFSFTYVRHCNSSRWRNIDETQLLLERSVGGSAALFMAVRRPASQPTLH